MGLLYLAYHLLLAQILFSVFTIFPHTILTSISDTKKYFVSREISSIYQIYDMFQLPKKDHCQRVVSVVEGGVYNYMH